MRIIAVILSVLMLISCVSVCADGNPINAAEEIEVLRELHIIPEAVESEQPVSRGKFASYLVKLASLPEKTDYNLSFADVNESSVYAAQIMQIADYGAMSGKSTFLFAPDDCITLAEASKAMIYMLGYDVVAKNEGGYPYGYLALAERLKLLKGISNVSELTENAVYKLIYNALEIPWAKQKTYGSDLSFVESEDSFLKTSFELYHVEFGVVSANENTSLSDETGTSNASVIIDNVQYADINKTASRLLGYGVEMYYSDDSGTKQLRFVRVADKTKVREISEDDIIQLTGSGISYFSGTKTVTEAFSLMTDFIYNGVSTSLADLAEQELDSCSALLIDAQGDGEPETVILSGYSVYYTDMVNHEEYCIKDRISEKVISFNEESGDITVFAADGRVTDFSGVYKGNLISVAVSKNEKLTSIYISGDTTGGTVTMTDEDGFYFGESYCKLNSKLKDTKYEPKSGDMGTVYFDKNGKVGIFIFKSTQGQKYGYIMAGLRKDGIENDLQLRIIDQSGAILTYDVSESCIVDGTAIRGFEDARLEHLKIDYNIDTRSVQSNIVQQLVTFSTDVQGKINNIDTEFMDSGSESESSLYSHSGKSDESVSCEQYTGLYNAKVFLDMDSSVVFNVPDNVDAYDEDDFYVTDFSSFWKSYGGAAVLKCYNEDIVNRSDIIVNYCSGSGDVRERSPLFVVDYLSKWANSDGDIENKLYGYYDGEYVSYTITDKKLSEMLPAGRTTLKRCDILKISTNIENEILAFKLSYNIDNRYNHDSGLPYNNNFQTETCDFAGTVYQNADNYFVVYYGWGSDLNDEYFNNTNYFSAKVSWGGFYIYDEEKDEIRIANNADIKSYKDYGDGASRVYCRFDYGICAGTVIIKLREN